jgi:hypothetical protein
LFSLAARDCHVHFALMTAAKKSSWALLVMIPVFASGACGGTNEGEDSDSSASGHGGGDGAVGPDVHDSDGVGGALGDGQAGEGGEGNARSGGGPATGGGGLGGSTSVTAEAFCTTYKDELCDWYQTCIGPTLACDSWLPLLNLERECGDAVVSLGEGFLDFQVETAEACLELIQGLGCDEGSPLFSPAIRAVCYEAFSGTVPKGGECTQAEFPPLFDECDDGFCLRPESDAGGLECLGVCTAYRTEGQTCGDADERCAADLNCVEGHCEPPSGLGENCESNPCETGLSCSSLPPYTCRELGELGGACTDSGDCGWPGVCIEDVCAEDAALGEFCKSPDSCVEGLYCRGAEAYEDQACAVPVAAGDPCDGYFDQCVDDYVCAGDEPLSCVLAYGAEDEACGAYGCEGGLWCDTSESTVGTCRPPVGEEEDCLANDSCQPGLLCMDDAKCHPLGEADDPCSVFLSESCATGLFCDRETGQCKPPRAEGEPCNPFVPRLSCEDGLYCACLSDSCPGISSGHDPADVCVAQKDDGEMCLSADECQSDYCQAGDSEDTCALPPGPTPNCSR